MDERAKFEKWFREELEVFRDTLVSQWLERNGDNYVSMRTQTAWEAWTGRASLSLLEGREELERKIEVREGALIVALALIEDAGLDPWPGKEDAATVRRNIESIRDLLPTNNQEGDQA